MLLAPAAFAQTVAPGGPGKDAYWSTAGKQAIGTSASLESKVWFTLAQGVMTEVYYPNITVANVQTLQFVVVDPKTKKVETEKDDADHAVKVLRPDSLSFQQINTSRSGDWTITKSYTSDTQSNSILIDVRFESKNPALNLYVYFDPSIANTGMHDTAIAYKNALVAMEADKSVALTFTSKIDEKTSGFAGTSDGLDQIKEFGSIVKQYQKAVDGNVVQMARILQPKRFTAVMTFAQAEKVFKGLAKIPTDIVALLDADRARKKGFAKCQAEYDNEWADYVTTLPQVDPKYQTQFNMAAMVLKAQEDKTVRGANVASLTIPWGGGVNANEDIGGGYHLVWARDLYHVFTAYLALGDKPAAERALDFLFNIQQKEDGSFPQNSWLDGKRGWGSLQMDEVGYPLIMAWQLGRFDKPTYEKHVKRAADFIVKNGPKTPQERWEEEAGFSPSTIAAEIAGLVCAAEIAKKNGDEASATIYLATADDWARNIERMTATTTGPYGDGNYYLRITQNANPDSGDKIELNNGAGTVDERTVVDAGFLELVRLGIKPANDPLIEKSV
ncbi:MAG: glycoside hydrolase family 15 protein, partial [Pyrinomonadaceae bacterium]